jgi:peroxiredoxin family protein
MTADRPKHLAMIVFSGEFAKVHYALATASAALAISVPATLFFTMKAITALTGSPERPGWHDLPTGESRKAQAIDASFAGLGVGQFEELLGACRELGATFLVCDMGLRAVGLTLDRLRRDIRYEEGGLVTFLRRAGAEGTIVFI